MLRFIICIMYFLMPESESSRWEIRPVFERACPCHRQSLHSTCHPHPCLLLSDKELSSFFKRVRFAQLKECQSNGCYFCSILNSKLPPSIQKKTRVLLEACTMKFTEMLGSPPQTVFRLKWKYRSHQGTIVLLPKVLPGFVDKQLPIAPIDICMHGRDTCTNVACLYQDLPGSTGRYTQVDTGCFARSTLLVNRTGPEEVDTLEAKKWLQACLRYHPLCVDHENSTAYNPTRLVYVGSPSEDPKLIITDGERQGLPYICLSHCWGDSIPYKLTKKRLKVFQTSIPQNQLTKTVRDAIRVTRTLGYLYIWVDYLCIIQDSKADWAREAAMMHEVYSRGVCTIAATWATSGNQGLFSKRDWTLITPKVIRSRLNTRTFDHIAYDPVESFETLHTPLGQRGWTYQEMILSPRIIHFAETRIFWTCSTHELSFTFPYESPQNLFLMQRSESNHGAYRTISTLKAMLDRDWDLMLNGTMSETQKFFLDAGSSGLVTVSAEDIILDERLADGIEGSTATSLSQFVTRKNIRNVQRRIWGTIVTRYCRREFTHETDRPIAIYGIVKEMEKRFQTNIICGHPINDLFANLLWVSASKTAKRLPNMPFWSWMSITGEIHVQRYQANGLGPKIQFVDVRAAPGPDNGSNTFGRYLRLVIRGRLARAITVQNSGCQSHRRIYFCRTSSSSENQGWIMPSNFVAMYDLAQCPSGVMGEKDHARTWCLGIIPRCPYTSEILDIPKSRFSEIYLLQTGGHGKYYDTDTPAAIGLVLQRKSRSHNFERLGLFATSTLSHLAELVEQYDYFDQSEIGLSLSRSPFGSSILYEITLV